MFRTRDANKLSAAAARGNLQDVRDLLDSGVPVDAECANKTPLVFAASWLKVDVVRLLLERGADVNHGSVFTAAGSWRRRSLMQLLLNYVHIDNKTGRHGRTQLHGACLLGNPNVTRGLLQFGADINLADNTGQTPLDFALGAIARTSRPSHKQILVSYLPSFWKLLFALTLGRMHRRAELAGHRIAPLIGSFVVGDVLLRKKR